MIIYRLFNFKGAFELLNKFVSISCFQLACDLIELIQFCWINLQFTKREQQIYFINNFDEFLNKFKPLHSSNQVSWNDFFLKNK